MTIALIVAVAYGLIISVIARRQYKLAVVLENMYVDVLERTQLSLAAMRKLDEKQMFEEDDDVGIVFRSLSDILKEYLEPEPDDTEGDND